LAVVRGEYNAVRVLGDAVGDAFFYGRGAGGAATASSVAADILGLATGRCQSTFASLRLWEEKPQGPAFAPDGFLSSRFYFRFTISDQPGVLAQIAGVLGRHGISIASVIQHETAEESDAQGVPLIIMSHHAEEGAVWAALQETDALAIVQRPTICLHVAD
jgi:homoserine dehydrogenase